jgi:N-acetylmuramoyl-L-alanine amidase
MKMILISAGHSDADPGAIAPDGTTEAALAVDLRDRLAARLRTLGCSVDEDGADGQNLPLSSAVKMIAGKVLAVEIHFNAAGLAAATGVECIALPGKKAAAQKLAAVTASTLGLKLRGAAGWIDQTQSHRGRLAFVAGGGLILEVAFISNPSDLAAYRARRDALVLALADTIRSLAL